MTISGARPGSPAANDLEREKNAPYDLEFVDDAIAGIARQPHADGFTYRTAEGDPLLCPDTLSRISGLGIPPAWRDVWICPKANGYLQATGHDEAGRKQYRYHKAWRAYRERTKFRELIHFGSTLPRIRRRIRRTFRTHKEADLQLVVAALVRLLDNAPLRIGSHSRATDAFGASTLRHRHVTTKDNTLRLDYTAKGGKRVRRQIKDARLMKVLDRIDDLPGQTVFRYIGRDGVAYPLRSEQVNEWLQTVTRDSNTTAKVFRTWSGTLAAFDAAVTQESLTIKAMSEASSKRLRNTPAISRRSYIHPAVIKLSEASWKERLALLNNGGETTRDLTQLETAMLRYLARFEQS